MRPSFTGGDLADAVGTRISKGTDLTEMKVQRHKGGVTGEVGEKARVGAFTLIELLAVIAIIGLLAGLVLATAGLATNKMRESRLRAEHQKIVTGIESYKAEMGNFPPDNQDSTLSWYTSDTTRHQKAGKNPLFYELTGCTFDSAGGGTFTSQRFVTGVSAANLKTAFGVSGVDNSARNKKDITFRGITFKPNEFAELQEPANGNVQILVTPLPGPWDTNFVARAVNKKLNPWFYDASSTNRHNLETYDLWTEYTSRDGLNGVKTIGNW